MPTSARDSEDPIDAVRPRAAKVVLPGFLVGDETGLGDVVTKITSALGFTPCSACKRRAALLNRWVGFRGK